MDIISSQKRARIRLMSGPTPFETGLYCCRADEATGTSTSRDVGNGLGVKLGVHVEERFIALCTYS